MGNNKQIIGLGIVSGMRATFGIGILSHFLSKKSSLSLKKSKLSFIQSPVTAGITKVLCAGEIIGDKLPNVPDRIGFPQILGRIASGALCGAIVSTNKNDSLAKGLILGGAGALIGSYAFYYIRQYMDGLPGVKDVYVAIAEDAIALGTGAILMK